MPIENEKTYPDCSGITRTVEVGGLSKSQLMQKLKDSSIAINEYGLQLFDDAQFTTSATTFSLHTVELTVANLGFPEGASLTQIFKRAGELGLKLCPLELGPHLRLQYTEQPDGNTGNSIKPKQAPSGSITIASEILSEDDNFPKGFYLRRIDDVLWLRGYCADDLHIWNPNDHFIFSLG